MAEQQKPTKRKAEKEEKDGEDSESESGSPDSTTQELPDPLVDQVTAKLETLSHEPKTPEKSAPFSYTPNGRISPYTTGKTKPTKHLVEKIAERPDLPPTMAVSKHLWIFSYDCQGGTKLPNLYKKVKRELVIDNHWFYLGNSSYLKWTDEGDYIAVRNEVFAALMGVNECQKINYVTFIRGSPAPTQNWSGRFVQEYKATLLADPTMNPQEVNQIADTQGAPNAH